MYRRVKRVGTFVIFCALIGGMTQTVRAQGTFSENFDSMAPGPLNGQNGWTSNGVASEQIGAGGGINSSNAALGGGPYSDPNTGSTFAMHLGNGPAGNLGAGGLTGRILTISMDARCQGVTNFFGVGQTGNSGSIFPGFAFATTIGIFDTDVRISRENVGAIASTQLNTIKPTYGANEWYTVKMIADLAANGGNGSGSLFIRSLTDGETSFTAVPGAQNINLQLLTTPAPNPLLWNGVGVWVQTSVSLPGSGGEDNVSMITEAPEPSSAMTALALLSLARVRFRRK